MHTWAGRDRYSATTDAAERTAAESEDLITKIVNALATSGEYVARVNLEPAQRVVDFKWAARQAGRRLGMRVDIDQSISKASDQAVVRVTGLRPRLE